MALPVTDSLELYRGLKFMAVEYIIKNNVQL